MTCYCVTLTVCTLYIMQHKLLSNNRNALQCHHYIPLCTKLSMQWYKLWTGVRMGLSIHENPNRCLAREVERFMKILMQVYELGERWPVKNSNTL